MLGVRRHLELNDTLRIHCDRELAIFGTHGVLL